MGIALSFPDRPGYGLNDAELMTSLDDITTAERRLAAARLERINEACARGIPALRGYAHPSGFLRDHLKLTPAAAGQMFRLAKALPDRPEINDALAKGDISETQAAVITRTITDIAPYATKQEQAQAAEMLVSQAVVLPPRELTICGNRILHHIAPEAAEKRDRERVERLERAAWESRSFSVTDDGHGRFRFRGTTTAEGAALLHAILDPLTHPRSAGKASPTRSTGTPADGANQKHQTQKHQTQKHQTQEQQGKEHATLEDATLEDATHEETAHGATPREKTAPGATAGQTTGYETSSHETTKPKAPGRDTASGIAEPDTAEPETAEPETAEPETAEPETAAPEGEDKLPPAFKDPRTAQQRRHDALVDACRLLLASDRLPENGGSKPQVTITAAFDAIGRQLTGGTFDTGAPLSAEAVRRMSCDAGILPAILDGHGVPLDLGRERRLVSGSLRKALVLRDRGCSFPGCDRPQRWCHAHHVVPWQDGGHTRLTNIALLCGFHHTRIHHEDGWKVHIGADGHAWFTAPPWLDPEQTPRRNLYHVSA